MEPDVVEIPPSMFTSGSRARKPRKAMPEVIDVEKYEFRNGLGVPSNNNVVDPRDKGKGIQLGPFSMNNVASHVPGTYDHNTFSQFGTTAMDVDDYTMFQNGFGSKNAVADVEVLNSWGLNSKGTAKSSRTGLRSQSTNANGNGNPFPVAPPVNQSWGFYSGSVFPQNNQGFYAASVVQQPQMPNIVMMPTPNSSTFSYDASASSSRSVAAPGQDSSEVRKTKEEFLRNFKRFDTVEDFRDHHYASKGKASKQHSKTWVKSVQNDWKILEKDLPETIFVRACESRMDLLRAVIIGPEGTPYHDGLFFFDIQFPDTYPSVPPIVYYHSGGLRINPNLYNCGKVCLSLLGTWSGNAREKWLPKESTMLQLLVSIQALILNQKPYFNEPGYAGSKGTTRGETSSKAYSENVFILSLRTMVYSLKRPPMPFEEFVRCHYFVRAHDIVKACNAYKGGAPVASMVKGGVQDLEETSHSQSGSMKFRTDVAGFMKTVIEEFVKLGVKELENMNITTNIEITNTANRKRSRSTSIKEFLANIGSCVFQKD